MLGRAGFRAIAVDQRGHGESDWAGSGAAYTYRKFAEDVRCVAAAIGRPVRLVGASLGGVASLLAAGEDPQVPIEALVLVDVTAHMRTDGVERIRGFMRSTADGFASVEEAADAIATYLPHRPRPTDLSGLQKNLRPTPSGRLRWHWDPAFLDRERDDRDRAMELAAARVTAPTLLLRGGASELVEPETAERFARLFPDATTIDVPRARHMVAGDENDAFTQAMVAFLTKALRIANAQPDGS